MEVPITEPEPPPPLSWVRRQVRRIVSPGSVAKGNVTAEVYAAIALLRARLSIVTETDLIPVAILNATSELLNQAQQSLQRGETRGGLYRMHSARRQLLAYASDGEKAAIALALLDESQKLQTWHGPCIRNLLSAAKEPDSDLLQKAIELRDNAVELKYAWLKFVVKQRFNVAVLAIVGMIALIALSFASSPPNQLLVSALAG